MRRSRKPEHATTPPRQTAPKPAPAAASPQASFGNRVVSQWLRDSGTPIEGADGVRVHDSPDANRAAHRMQARALTAGNHIFFGTGQFSPGTFAGRALIAHEMAHTAQPNPAGQLTPRFKRQPKAPPEFWDPLDRAAAEDQLFFHRPFYAELRRLALAVNAGNKTEVMRLVNELVKMDGIDPASFTRINDFTYELTSRVYLLDLPGAAEKLRKYFESDRKSYEADRSPYGQGRRDWTSVSAIAAAAAKIGSIAEAKATIDLSTLVFRGVRDEMLRLDQEAIRREIEYQKSMAQLGEWDPFWGHDRGYSAASYQGLLISLLQTHATLFFKAYQVLLDKAIADLEAGKGNAALNEAKAALENKIADAVGKDEKNVGRITLPITKSKFGNRRDRHLDVFASEKEAEKFPVAITYYSRDTTEGWDRDMFLGRFLEIRRDQITFLERLYGSYVAADPKDKEQKKIADDSPLNSPLMKDRKFHLHNVDDWRKFLKDKLDGMLKAGVRKDKAFINLIELIGAYLKAFTYHTPYNIEEFGPNYLTRKYPRALTGQLIHDCGIYALRTAYMLSLVGKDLGLEIRFVQLPVHVGLVITGKDLPLVIFQNDEYTVVEHENPKHKPPPDPSRPKTYEELQAFWVKESAKLPFKHSTSDKQFFGELAAAQFYDRVDVPFEFVGLPAWVKSKEDYMTFYHTQLLNPVLADDKKAGITEFHTRYLAVNEELKNISNAAAIFWNDNLTDFWQQCQARLMEAVKRGDHRASEAIVREFKKLVSDRIAATKAALDKLDEERGKVSETLRSHPKLLRRGVDVAAGNLLIRELTWWDVLEKYGKLVEQFQLPAAPSLDSIKPWSFNPKSRFQYQE